MEYPIFNRKYILKRSIFHCYVSFREGNPIKVQNVNPQNVFCCFIQMENAGTLGWYPSSLSPPRSPLKGDIPNKYPLYKVYIWGWLLRGPHPKGFPTIFPMIHGFPSSKFGSFHPLGFAAWISVRAYMFNHLPTIHGHGIFTYMNRLKINQK